MVFYGAKIAKQKSKGGPRDGNAKERVLPKIATRSYETAKGSGKGSSERGTPPVVGKY